MPFGEIGEVGFIVVRVILIVEFSLDEHPSRPFFNAKFNLDGLR